MPYKTSRSSSSTFPHSQRGDGRLGLRDHGVADALLVVIDLAEDADTQMELLLDQIGSGTSGRRSGGRGDARAVKRALVAANKKDLPGAMENFDRLRSARGSRFPMVALSCLKKEGLEDLKRGIFQLVSIIRVYSKPPGKDPDLSMPYTVPAGSTVMDVAEKVHKDFVTKLKYARVWGSAKFDGMRVERTHVLKDRDIIELSSEHGVSGAGSGGRTGRRGNFSSGRVCVFPDLVAFEPLSVQHDLHRNLAARPATGRSTVSARIARAPVFLRWAGR